ncbi:hypothetical protein D3C86_938230 [compost metagenome]
MASIGNAGEIVYAPPTVNARASVNSGVIVPVGHTGVSYVKSVSISLTCNTNSTVSSQPLFTFTLYVPSCVLAGVILKVLPVWSETVPSGNVHVYVPSAKLKFVGTTVAVVESPSQIIISPSTVYAGSGLFGLILKSVMI